MEAVRREILPAVSLTHIRTDKFKTGCLSVNLLTQLDRETASMNALIPQVLRRGTARHPDMQSLNDALDLLYGAQLEPVTRTRGEIQLTGFCATFVEDRWLPEGSRVLEQICALMGELLLAPNTRGGLLLPAYVESEQDKLLEQIRGAVNDKRSYALRRLRELMCPYEAYAVDRLGDESSAENLDYKKLTRQYRTLLASSPVEIVCVSGADTDRLIGALTEALVTMPRGEIDENLGTDIRMNAVEDHVRSFTEELEVTQGKLAVGFRLGDCMEDPDEAVLRVLNAVYGGSVTSKLFTHVREELSLCYYASSSVNLQKGIMTVSSGIEFDRYDQVLGEIYAQLDAVRAGDITAQELDSAKKYVASGLVGVEDSALALEGFYLTNALEGMDCTPAELAAAVETVTADEVAEAAAGIEADAVYFLRGSKEADHEA